jgi:hypothetical protein
LPLQPQTPNGAQAGNLGDAILQGIAAAGDEVARHHGKIAFQVVGQAHRAPHLGDGHVGADVNVADLRNTQAIQRRRKIGDGNFHFAHREAEALGCKAVHRAHKRRRARNHSCGLKKVAPGMIDVFRANPGSREHGRGRRGQLFSSRRAQALPQPLRAGNKLDEQVGKNRTEKPQAEE